MGKHFNDSQDANQSSDKNSYLETLSDNNNKSKTDNYNDCFNWTCKFIYKKTQIYGVH